MKTNQNANYNPWAGTIIDDLTNMNGDKCFIYNCYLGIVVPSCQH